MSNNFRMPPSWIGIDIFNRNILTTSSEVDSELWSLLKSYSEVKKRGCRLVGAYKIENDEDKVWEEFRAYIRQAQNYWESAKTTSYQTAALLYYFSFMNLAKAYLTLKQLNKEPMKHGLFRKRKLSKSMDIGNSILGIENGTGKIFASYYNEVFNVVPAKEVSLKYLLAFVTDISFQYSECGLGKVKTFPVVYRIAIDKARKKCWTVLAMRKGAPYVYYRSHLEKFFEEMEISKSGGGIGPGFREMFGLSGLQWPAFDYFQTKKEKEVDFLPNGAPVGLLIFKLQEVLNNKLSPNYNHNEYDAYLNFPKNRKILQPMNEEIAIYASMFYMSELVRYRPNYLDAILESEVSWLFESFVQFCPLKYLRAITARIIKPIDNRTLIITRN